jgi:hypothetical protein
VTACTQQRGHALGLGHGEHVDDPRATEGVEGVGDPGVAGDGIEPGNDGEAE